MRYRRLVAGMAALALGGCLGMTAPIAASAAPVHAGDRSRAQLAAQVGNGDKYYLFDANAGTEEYLSGPDTNPEQAFFWPDKQNWWELELKSGTTYHGMDTYWLCGNGSSHHCLQDEDGPVDVADEAATGGQYWFFVADGGDYAICNYYWTVHNDAQTCIWNYYFDGYAEATAYIEDPFALQGV
jgi:hypothetical protein